MFDTLDLLEHVHMNGSMYAFISACVLCLSQRESMRKIVSYKLKLTRYFWIFDDLRAGHFVT